MSNEKFETDEYINKVVRKALQGQKQFGEIIDEVQRLKGCLLRQGLANERAIANLQPITFEVTDEQPKGKIIEFKRSKEL